MKRQNFVKYFGKKRIILLLIISVIIGCTSNTIYKKPKDLIPKSQMIDLLVDMHLANAAANIRNKNSEHKLDYMALVYEKYGIDSLRFQRSNLYYMSRIDDYEAMYKKVDKRLSEMLETARAQQKLEDTKQ